MERKTADDRPVTKAEMDAAMAALKADILATIKSADLDWFTGKPTSTGDQPRA